MITGVEFEGFVAPRSIIRHRVNNDKHLPHGYDYGGGWSPGMISC